MIKNLRSTNASSDGRRHLNETEVAERLKLSKRTLQGWRLKGEGPNFEKFGRSVRYAESTLETWIAECERGSTTALGRPEFSNIHRTDLLPHLLQGGRS